MPERKKAEKTANALPADKNYFWDSLLALAPHYSLYRLRDGKHLLLSETRSVKLNDPFYAHVMPLLDGRLTGRQIVEYLVAKIPADQDPDAFENVTGFIGAMIDKSYVVAVEPNANTARTALRSAAGLDPAEVAGKLAARKIAIIALGDDGAAGIAATADFTAMLAAEGFRLAEPETADLCIVVVEDYLQPALQDWANRFAERGQAWIPFKPGGTQVLFGPLIAPHAEGGACYSCLARRMVEHRPGDQVIGSPVLGPRPAKGWTRASLALAHGLATMELVDYALERRRDVADTIVGWLPADGSRERHPAPEFFDCPQCGTAGTSGQDLQPKPVRLAETDAINDLDGGWRALPQDVALERLERIVSPLTGIVSHHNPTHPGEGLYVFTASQGTRAALDPRQNRRLGRPSGASGKGVSEVQAKISCLAEATERYSCQWSGAERRKTARWTDIADSAPHPHLLLGHSDHQYENREELNKHVGMMGRIPERFRDDAVVEWSPAWSLRDDAPRWLPTRYCYFDYQAIEVPGDHPFCFADSNGCSSGGSLEEAILQGFFEVVERDAISLWWYNRLPRRAIAAEGLDDAFMERMRAHYDSIGRTFYLLDLTSDLGIPAMTAVSTTKEGGRILVGFGAHLDGKVAALRALSELNQILLFDDVKERESNTNVDDFLWNWLDNETLAGHPYLAPSDEPALAADELPRPRFATMAEAVRHCVDLVADEHDFIVHDLSRRDLPLNCVRVVVPGLRHFWNRRAPGRLYDIPVKMGWLEKPLSEDELNPISFFI